jgi:ABC-type glycerol-3-phosphate transport system permease component
MVKKKNYTVLLPTYILLFLGVIIIIFPFFWMILSSFKTQSEIVAFPPTFFPNTFMFKNFVDVWVSVNFKQYFINSILILIIKTIIIIYTSIVAGYVFSKLKFKGRNFIFLIVLSTMMVPPTVTILSLYQEMFWFRWIDSYNALIWTAMFNTFGIFVMKQFISGIPNSLIESARIDGASEFRILHKIIIPLIKPALSALTVFISLMVWNDFLWPFLVLNSKSKYTIPVGLALFKGQYFIDYAKQLTGATITVVPVLIIYFFLQKQFVEGITFSGMKE